ncbi:AAA family ATPase [Chryseobacterium arachidis]|uniref:AAA family ATPase n=1 Tax=Chryseobacterium arachidis TaxID=1416778 RepID=UPI003610401D
MGIHPYQLFRLMKFLKEKSRSNQIVITTHSPLSLDILEINELDSILIAEKSDGQTQLKRLSKEKIEKAKMYMSDLNLSDFWLNSDLED